MSLEVIRSRDAYQKLCETEETIPLFSQAWWLDAAAADSWDALLCYQAGQVVGALPFVLKSRWGITMLTQPKLTQTLGPWLRPGMRSNPKALAFEKDVLGSLADGLPRCHYYSQNWHHCRQNWLPFYWRGFRQTTRYTYRLEGLGNEELIWRGLQQNIRSDIRKARDRFGLNIRPSRDLDEFLALNRMTFARQGRSPPYASGFVARLDAAAAARAARDCVVAVDPEDKPHAGAYIVRHGDTAYYLMGGADPKLRNSGATSFVLWEAMRSQPQEIRNFDFEGSMIEPIERFFRAFGAQQVPYFNVTRVNSRWLFTVDLIRRMITHSAQ